MNIVFPPNTPYQLREAISTLVEIANRHPGLVPNDAQPTLSTLTVLMAKLEEQQAALDSAAAAATSAQGKAIVDAAAASAAVDAAKVAKMRADAAAATNRGDEQQLASLFYLFYQAGKPAIITWA